MIIWLNGAFGVGKSETAAALNKNIKNSFVYDPEQVGYFLWDNFPDEMKRKGDFQHIPMWRDFNYQMLKYMNDSYKGTLIVPMTIYCKEYFDEIIQRLKDNGAAVHHFILYAEKSTIIERLKKRGEAENCWAEQQIDKCLSAFNKNITETKIYTDTISIDNVVLEIAKHCSITLATEHAI